MKVLFFIFMYFSKQLLFSQVALDGYSHYFSTDGGKTPQIVLSIALTGSQLSHDEIADLYPECRSEILDAKPKWRTYITTDSSDVHFFINNVNSTNASFYEFQVSQNREKIILPWSKITKFSADSLQLLSLEKGTAYLGGFRPDWSSYLVVELRDAKTKRILESAVVYWKQVKPEIVNIYNDLDFNLFIKRLKYVYRDTLTRDEIKVWDDQFSNIQIDSITKLPKIFQFKNETENFIFLFKGETFTRTSIEYQLVKDGKIIDNWKANDYDNSFIWLKGLEYGNYTLNVRYAIQRHNIARIAFTILPPWYLTQKWMIIFSIIGFLLTLVTILFIRQKRQLHKSKIEKENLEASIKIVRSQLNPHFIFNALSSIQGLVNANMTKEANHYLTSFSNLLRQTLKNTNKEMVPLHVELETLQTYIHLEQLRFPFKYKQSLDDNIDLFAIEIPYLLMQPLVENAIKHGVSGKGEDGILEITIIKKDQDLLISIHDNGKGFNSQHESTGYGIKLTQQRILLLNYINIACPIFLDFESTSQFGTMAILKFKNWFSL